MKCKISLEELGDQFRERDKFTLEKNIEANDLVMQNLDSAIALIENIDWKLFAKSNKDTYQAITTLIPLIFQKLHVAYELYARGYRGDAQSNLRCVIDALDLFHLFSSNAKLCKKWIEDDTITGTGKELAPCKVRELIGKSREVEKFSSLFSKYVHPTSRDAHDYFFALVEEDGALKVAPSDDMSAISLHMNLGGVHGEGENWIELLFINIMICRFMGQIDMYLYDYIPSGLPDELFWNSIRMTNLYCRKHIAESVKELGIHPKEIKKGLVIAGIVIGSVGDQIILARIGDDFKRLSKLEKAVAP